LARVSLKAGKTTEKASILAGQLEKISLSLIITREKEAAIVLKVGYIICRLMTPRVQDKVTQIMEITY
jgi:hypothetical protein